MHHFDLCIIGAGVCGLSIARHFANGTPQNFSILVLEKNAGFGEETSSRNSEVIHGGIYYPPGSLKAQLCVEGKDLLYKYCEQFHVPHRRLGKLIVAADSQAAELERIALNARSNGVDDLELLSSAQLNALEPSVSAAHALLSPSTGIIDSHEFMRSLEAQGSLKGVQYSYLTSVQELRQSPKGFHVLVETGPEAHKEAFRFSCSRLVNAGGLHAQSIAKRIEGVVHSSIPSLHLARGHYFSLMGKAPFSHLIYPVPEANQQGLGIHATLDMGGQVRFGPDVEYLEAIDYQVDERRKQGFLEAIQRYYPAIEARQLIPAYSGIRPKLSAAGEPARDFVVQGEREHGVKGLIQLFGIESPGLTASLALARHVFECEELALD
ncbi:MAG: NAD(P)/FAD-dependent oxidoreductase [Pseudohongiellaceae bacterium]|nr:NAD(P)/FAD-dependent oxidoreductase [Pseudohongiellaceae bacterium]